MPGCIYDESENVTVDACVVGIRGLDERIQSGAADGQLKRNAASRIFWKKIMSAFGLNQS